jgi:catechol 2,3-dioxygenase-like lactoylglutathione lyase family enzyme
MPPAPNFPVPARVNLVTLGVADLARSSAFYERLGWVRKARAWEAHIHFFALGNLVLALFPRAELAADAKLPNTPPGFGGVTLAINLASEGDVDRAFASALACGASALKPPVKAEWGGYSGYVADPDGYPWELAFNPFLPLDAHGLMVLPD